IRLGQQRVGVLAVGHVLHAHRQGDVRQVQAGVAHQAAQVDFDELRQVGRQAGDVEFGGTVGDDLAGQLDGRADVGVQVVDRNLGGDGLGGIHALEVDVQDLGLVGVPLGGTHQDRLGLAVQDHVQDRGVELFLVESVVDLVVVELDIGRRGLAAVHNGGNPAG